ncbi:MAG: efflux RND transporter permease subunit [Nitratireductor sp.]
MSNLPLPAFQAGGGIVRLFTRHPNAANLVMVLMIMFGIFSIGRINTQFFPTLETKVVSVVVSWPGASAEDVEANILQIIEPEVRFIDGVDKISSYAREGSGTLSLEFSPSTEMQKATSDVDAAVKALSSLPEDSEAPRVSRISFFDRVATLSLSGDVPESTLRIHARKIRDDLIARGIDKITFRGLRNEELQVDIPERELRRLGMSIGEISQRVSGNTRDMPSGQTGGAVERQLRSEAEFKSPQALAQLEIRSFASGEKVLLGDIADIRNGFEDGQVQGFAQGSRAIEIAVQRSPTADTLATAKILDDYLGEIRNTLPPGLELQKYDVASDALLERIMLLVRNGVSGLVLVVAILFVFLNARIAFWVAAGIPVAMLATIGMMLLLGQTINMITLFALIMMLGIIVDDAIVVGEHTATRYAMGDSPLEAAETGAGHMAMPVMAAMTTTVAAFAPIFLVRDVIGQIMGTLPVVVIAVILASLVECFLVLPGHLAHALTPKGRGRWSHLRHLAFSFAFGALALALSARASSDAASLPILSVANHIAAAKAEMPLPLFIIVLAAASFLVGALVEAGFALVRRMRKSGNSASQTVDLEAEEGPFRRGFDRGFAWFRDGPFARLVQLSFEFRYVTLAVTVSCIMVVVFGLLLGGRVSFVFFPSPESENLTARIVFNAGLPEQRTRDILDAVEQSLDQAVRTLTTKDEKVVSAVFTTLGQAGRNTGDNLAEMNVQLVPSEFRDIRTPDVLAAWRKALPRLPGVNRISLTERRGGPPGRDVDLELTGGDVTTLKKAAVEIIDVMSEVPGLTGVADDLPWGKPELVMTLLPRGSALGFTLEDVGRQVRDAFEGAIPRRFARNDDEVKIRLTMGIPGEGAAALRNLELRSPSGEFVPLTEVVNLSDRQGFSSIRRQDGKTIVSVSGDLDTQKTTTDAAIKLLSENSAMPQIAEKYGLDWRFSGRAEERARAFEDLQIGVFVALSVIYIILAWTFSDYWRPFAIMLIIPLGIVGAICGHWLLGYQLTIMSMISLLGLAGILVNDSIVLVSRMDERLAEGEALEAAAVGASRDRLRAVLLTSLTTIGGLVPLMFEKSIQAQFMVPMAVTIIFGLGLATAIVLFLVPALVGIGADMRWIALRIFGGREQQVSAAE